MTRLTFSADQYGCSVEKRWLKTGRPFEGWGLDLGGPHGVMTGWVQDRR